MCPKIAFAAKIKYINSRLIDRLFYFACKTEHINQLSIWLVQFRKARFIVSLN